MIFDLNLLKQIMNFQNGTNYEDQANYKHLAFDLSSNQTCFKFPINYVRIFRLLHINDIKIYPWSMEHAVCSGDLDLVKWLHYNTNQNCGVQEINDAAFNGHLEVVKWLHKNRNGGCSVHAMDWAALNGHLEVLQWLYENRTALNAKCEDALDNAALNGHLDVLKWLYDNRSTLDLECSSFTMYNALRRKRYHVVEWLENNVPMFMKGEIAQVLFRKVIKNKK